MPTANIYERDNHTFCPFGGDLRVDLDTKEKEYFSWREISRESLTLRDALGEGEFGMVMKATWLNEENQTPISVAVKTIKGKFRGHSNIEDQLLSLTFMLLICV